MVRVVEKVATSVGREGILVKEAPHRDGVHHPEGQWEDLIPQSFIGCAPNTAVSMPINFFVSHNISSHFS